MVQISFTRSQFERRKKDRDETTKKKYDMYMNGKL